MKKYLALFLAVMLIAVFAVPAMAADVPIYDFNTVTNNQLHEYKAWVGGHYETKHPSFPYEYGALLPGYVGQIKDLVDSGTLELKLEGGYAYNLNSFNGGFNAMTDHTLTTTPNHITFMRMMRGGYYVPPYNDNLADSSLRNGNYQGSLQQLSTFTCRALQLLIDHAEIIGFTGSELTAAKNQTGLYNNHGPSAIGYVTRFNDLLEALGFSLEIPCVHDGDTYDDVTLEPTCEENGSKDVYCELCDELLEEGVVVPALDHNYVKTDSKAASCLVDGYEIWVCQNDESHTYTVTDGLEALGHRLNTRTVDATCEQDGRKTEFCNRGGCDYKVDTVIPALGHRLNTRTVEATCEQDGRSTEFCNRASCDYKVDTVIAALGHRLNTRTEEATYEKDGRITEFCNRGGCDYKVVTIIPALKEEFVSAADAEFISIVETAKNSRVWELTFSYTASYSSGRTETVSIAIYLNGNNANLSGAYQFTDGDLAGYTLNYDIKGNGSNIKTFFLTQ